MMDVTYFSSTNVKILKETPSYFLKIGCSDIIHGEIMHLYRFTNVTKKIFKIIAFF